MTEEAVAEAAAERFDDEAAAPAPAAPRLPKALDESVMAVLREEAEREVQARRAETPRALETQGDLGLEAPAAAAPAEPPARPRPAEGAVGLAAAPAALAPQDARGGSRRDLLPDIEEINSTLRATSDREDEAEVAPELPPSRSGFRSGFVLMMVLLVALTLAYTMAPRIAAQMPGAAPAMQSYVRGVDAVRLWLDNLVKSATGAVEEVSPAATDAG